MDLVLSQDQQDAMQNILSWIYDNEPGEYVLTGHSGTGKTTLTKALLKEIPKHIKFQNFLLDENKKLRIKLTATTNKAAKVLSDVTGKPTKTIHSLLNLKVVNNFKTGTTFLSKTKDSEIVANTLLIIDEFSMIDEALLKMIRKQTMKCMILFIGDALQIPPVFSTECPVIKNPQRISKLTEIQRQVRDNPIVQLGEDLRKAVTSSKFPLFESKGNNIFKLDGDDFKQAIQNTFSSSAYEMDADEAKILCYTNARVKAYNQYIRKFTGQKKEFSVGEWVVTNNPIISTAYAHTDSVLKITSIEESEMRNIEGFNIILNGNIRTFLPKDDHQKKVLMKEYAADKNWSAYFYIKDNMADLRSAHASTCHKAQGSTYKNVFIDLTDISKCTQKNLTARLLYVACTRAQNNVFFYGDLAPRFYK